MINRQIRLENMTVSLDEYGESGPPVLLLHGIPGSRMTWRGAATQLDGRHRVYVPDLAGFGDSSAPGDEIHADAQADVLLELLAALGIDRADVVGFDFGGPTALRMYAKSPARVRSLMLLATNTFVDTPVPLPLRVAAVPGLGRLAFRLFFGRIGLTLMWYAAVRARDRYPLEKHRALLASPRTVRSTRWVFHESLRDLDGRYRDVQRTLAAISVPTTVVWSDGDPFFSLAVGERLAASIRDARFAVVKGVGHFIPEEASTEVARLIHEHLGRSHREHAVPANA